MGSSFVQLFTHSLAKQAFIMYQEGWESQRGKEKSQGISALEEEKEKEKEGGDEREGEARGVGTRTKEVKSEESVRASASSPTLERRWHGQRLACVFTSCVGPFGSF